jgi:hypothetical protein
MATKPLPLTTSRRTATFRALEAILRADHTLRKVVADKHWYTWDGSPASAGPLPANLVAIRLTPAPGPAEFWSPTEQESLLFIDVELTVPGLLIDDLLNLWQAVERAIYPEDHVVAMQHVATLQAASGGAAGMVKFSQPARLEARQEKGGAAVGLAAYAQLAVPVRTPS